MNYKITYFILLLGMEKDNPTIQAVYSENLSFEELIILGKLYAFVKATDMDYCAYQLTFSEQQYALDNISKAAFCLLERKIEWVYSLENEQKYIGQTNLLSNVEIVQNIDLQIIAQIPPSVKNAFLSIKSPARPFAYLNLPFLKMSTSLRLYMLILQNTFQDWGSCVIGLEKLKTELNVADKYSLFANFKIKILEESQKRLTAETGYKFEFSEAKTGHKVTAIRFRIEKHPLLDLFEHIEMAEPLLPYLPQPEPEIPNMVIETVKKGSIDGYLKQKIADKLGVTPRMIKKLAEDYSEAVLQKALLVTEKALEKGSIKGSPAGFFVEAVRQNYQLSADDEQAKRQAEAREKAEILAKKEAEARQIRENLKKQEFEIERNSILQEVMQDGRLRETITERIRYSIFHACYDVTKNFTENLENPSFLAAVLNYYKIVKK